MSKQSGQRPGLIPGLSDTTGTPVHYEQTVRAAAGPKPRVVRTTGTPVNYEQTVSNPRVPGYTGTL